MRLDVADLREALRVTGVAIDSRPTVPMLAGVRIVESADGTASFSATNWNSWITKTVPVVGDATLSVLVPHVTLSAIAKVIAGPFVELINTGSRVTITSGRSTWTAPTFDDELPRNPSQPPEFGIVDSEAFAFAVHAIASAAGRGDPVPELAALRIETTAGQLSLATTDSYRFHGTRVPFKSTGDSVLAWPAAAAIDQLTRGLRGDLALLFDGQMFGMRNDSLVLLTRTLEGKMPSFESFIDKMSLSGGFTTVETAGLTSAVKSTLFALEKDACPILTVNESEIRISTGSEDGSAEAVIDSLKHDGDQVRIGIDPRFLLDAANSIGSQQITMHWAVRPSLPIVIDGPGSDVRSIVMPIRLPR